MKTLSTTVKVLTCAIFIMAFTSLAQAQAIRTWVSGVGNDANPCSRTAPCKTFAGAISKTFINGEIDALDPGGYGTVTITKSITIDGGETLGSILASGTNGVNISIAVSANDPKRRVTLRRLSINGAGSNGAIGTNTGLIGIRVHTNGANQVHVEDCYIQNFATTGIDVALSETASQISVKNTVLTDTGVGIQMNTSTGFVLGTFDNVRIEKMTTGINAKDRAFLTIRGAYITNCSTAGIAVNAPSNVGGIHVEGSVLFSCTTGIAAGNAGTKVDIANTSFVSNSNLASSTGAALSSHNNNHFFNNTIAGPAFTPVGQQ